MRRAPQRLAHGAVAALLVGLAAVRPPAGAAERSAEGVFDRLVGPPVSGFERANTTRVGPAILELARTPVVDGPTLWIRAYLQPAQWLRLAPDPVLEIGRVSGAGGTDLLDASSPLEAQPARRRLALALQVTPRPHLVGVRAVALKPGTRASAVARVEGTLRFVVAEGIAALAFTAEDVKRHVALRDLTLVLDALHGRAATFRVTGRSERLIALRAYDADGNDVSHGVRSVVGRTDATAVALRRIGFAAPPRRIVALVAARRLERSFAFTLSRGDVAAAVPDAVLAARAVSIPAVQARALRTPESDAPARGRETAAPAGAATAAAKSAGETASPARAPAIRDAHVKPAPRAAATPLPRPAKASSAPASAETAPAGAARRPRYNDLVTAVWDGDLAGLRELLDLGRWADAPGQDGDTPLIVAVRLRRTPVARLLLEHGADANAAGRAGATPLDVARRQGNAELEALLRRYGAR